MPAVEPRLRPEDGIVDVKFVIVSDAGRLAETVGRPEAGTAHQNTVTVYVPLSIYLVGRRCTRCDEPEIVKPRDAPEGIAGCFRHAAEMSVGGICWRERL